VQPDPEQSILAPELEVGFGPKRDLKLVAKDKVFKRDVATNSEASEKAAE